MKSFLKRLVYDPRRHARRDGRIALHPQAILLDSARFHFHGRGGRVEIGADSMVGADFIFESDEGLIRVGARSYIGGGTRLISRSEVSVGDDVTIGWGVYLYDHNSHSLDYRERARDIKRQNEAYRLGQPLLSAKDWSTVKSAPVRVENRAWIGFEAVILKGVTIGEGAVVAARSVVTRDVAPYTIVGGNPAVPIGEAPR